MNRGFLLTYLKGMAMGAVDVVPGVSGGTMALIIGIYDRLLGAFAQAPRALAAAARGRLREAWAACDAGFLALVLAGILTSVFTLARLIGWLMEAHPVPLWSFFLGLVAVSVHLVGREVGAWRAGTVVAFLAGFALAAWIALAVPLQLPASPLVLFLGGAIAICAMILPGISGSFILVLLGLYPAVLLAVRTLDIPILAVFAAGCALGLLSFARLLSWLLSAWRNLTMAFLTGLVLGSLGKVWPWKHTLTWQTDSRGERSPLVQENLLPGRFAEVTGQDPQVALALALAVVAVLLVLWVDWLGRRHAAEAAAGAGR
ncbi:DUF368 domain-containing protein [Coralloluteibacterium thermophilus]|uniref:DUF368 domain-containing protein n=1 Tax=Coralloluteibacterium thermophilum TaxID=2707049 RepID=A0ABV9NQA7_9GAMM